MAGKWLSGDPGEHVEQALAATVQAQTQDRDRGGLRHLEFSDPPGGMDPERYEAVLRTFARAAPSAVALTGALLRSLGLDLVQSHDADPEAVYDAVTAFAARLWAEEHEGDSP